ncbi:MAG: hypothetical protein ABIK65_00075 [Candidatus Eisenbacteria bacterium]
MRRRRRVKGTLVGIAALLALLSGAGRPAAQVVVDELEDVRTDSLWVRDLKGDSVWVDSVSYDSIRTVVLEDSLSKIPTVTIDDVPKGFHPSYQFRSSRMRQTTNIEQVVDLDYLLRDNLVAKTQNTWTKNKSDRAGRETDVRKSQVQLQYRVGKGLKVGLTYNRDSNTEREQLRSTDIVRNRLALSSVYLRNIGDALQLTVNVEGGMDRRDKDEESSSMSGADPITKQEEKRGNSISGSTILKYAPRATLNVELLGDATRSGFAVKTGGSAQQAAESKDNRDAIDRGTVRIRWEDFAFAKMNAQFSVEESERQFVRPAGGIETTTDSRRNARVGAMGVLSRNLDYDAKLDYSLGKRRYAIDQWQGSDRVDLQGDVSLGYRLPSNIKSRVTLKRSMAEDKSFPVAGFPDNSVKTQRGSVLLNVSRDFWKYTKIRTTGSVGMVRRFFADSTQDKDNLDRRLSLNLDYQPPGKIQGSALLSVDEVTTVNIDKARSSNNETRQSWRVSPTVDYRPRSGLSVQSAYTMTLIYIYKKFDSNRNTMTRVSELRSTVAWDMTKRSKLDLEYRFKLDESGDFRKEGSTRRFAQEREGSSQKLALRVRYSIMKNFSWESGQFVQVEKSYDLSEGKELEGHKTKSQIYNQLSYRRKITDSTQLNVKAKQIQDATVPIFQRSGSLRGDERRIDWELTGSLTIKL